MVWLSQVDFASAEDTWFRGICCGLCRWVPLFDAVYCSDTPLVSVFLVAGYVFLFAREERWCRVRFLTSALPTSEGFSNLPQTKMETAEPRALAD